MKTKSSHSISRLRRTSLSLAITASFGLIAPLAAHAMQIDWRLKATAAGVADGGRDLGLTDADDTREVSVAAMPWAHLQCSLDRAPVGRFRGYEPVGSEGGGGGRLCRGG